MAEAQGSTQGLTIIEGPDYNSPDTLKPTTSAWKIWLALILAVLVGSGIGITCLLLTKAMTLLVSILAALAPYFVLGILGAIIATQLVAILLLLRANLDPKMRRRLLWIGVYSLPLSGAGLALLIIYTLFGATAIWPLMGAGLIGFVIGGWLSLYLTGLIQASAASQQQPLPLNKPASQATPATQLQLNADSKQMQRVPLPSLLAAKNASVKGFFNLLAKKLEHRDAQGIHDAQMAKAFFAKPESQIVDKKVSKSQVGDDEKASNLDTTLIAIQQKPSALVYFAVILDEEKANKDFFAEVNPSIIEALGRECASCLGAYTEKATTHLLSQKKRYDDARQEKSGLIHLSEILNEAYQAKCGIQLPSLASVSAATR